MGPSAHVRDRVCACRLPNCHIAAREERQCLKSQKWASALPSLTHGLPEGDDLGLHLAHAVLELRHSGLQVL